MPEDSRTRERTTPAQLRLAEKLDFWDTFTHADAERMLLGAADEIERLQKQVERVEQAIENQWQYGKSDVRVITLHRLRVALDG